MSAAAYAGWTAALCAAARRDVAAARLARHAELVADAGHELRGPLCAARLGLHGLDDRRARRGGRPGAAAGRARAGGSGRRRGAGGARARGRSWSTSARCSTTPRRPGGRSRRAFGAALAVEPMRGRALVRADPVRLAQACGNLVANAVEHGALAGARARPRGRGAGARGGAATRGRACRRRSAAPGAAAPPAAAPARGRGLAIAARIAERHGGRLAAAPSAARRLPRARAARARTRPRGRSRARSGRRTRRGCSTWIRARRGHRRCPSVPADPLRRRLVPASDDPAPPRRAADRPRAGARRARGLGRRPPRGGGPRAARSARRRGRRGPRPAGAAAPARRPTSRCGASPPATRRSARRPCPRRSLGRRPVAAVPRGAYLGAGQLEDESAPRPARCAAASARSRSPAPARRELVVAGAQVDVVVVPERGARPARAHRRGGARRAPARGARTARTARRASPRRSASPPRRRSRSPRSRRARARCGCSRGPAEGGEFCSPAAFVAGHEHAHPRPPAPRRPPPRRRAHRRAAARAHAGSYVVVGCSDLAAARPARPARPTAGT